MNFDLQSSFTKWRNDTSDRVKLQHVYFVIAIASVLIAGLVGLVSYDTGQQLVAIGLVSLGLFLVNAVVWTLVDGLLLARIDRSEANTVAPVVKSPRTAKKRTTKK